MATEVEETIKRIQAHKGVMGVVIVNHEGIPIKSSLDNATSVLYAGLIGQLTEKARNVVREMKPLLSKDHTKKVNKYYDLTNELTKNGFVVSLYAEEVDARGIPAKSLYNLLKDLGLTRTATSSILERVSKAALVGSYKFGSAGRTTRAEEDSTNELSFLRVRSRRHEILIAPDREFILIVIQNTSD